jgi:hypothetical protein
MSEDLLKSKAFFCKTIEYKTYRRAVDPLHASYSAKQEVLKKKVHQEVVEA